MITTERHQLDRPIGGAQHLLHGSVLLRFVPIGNGICRFFRWLQKERPRNATIRELSHLNDPWLNDISIKRSEIALIAGDARKISARRRPHGREIRQRHSFRRSLWSVASRAVAGLITTMLAWHRRARERRQLLSLDEAALKDWGATRADAIKEGGKYFWQA